MLEGKTVNITNTNLLQVFYPDYQAKSILFFNHDDNIIYMGKDRKDLIGYLSSNTKSFINTVGPYEYDFDDRGTLVDFVFGKWGKSPKNELREILINIPVDEFNNYIKIYWFLGKMGDMGRAGVGIYDLYKVIGKSKKDLLPIYLELLESYPINMLESSVLTFVEKSFSVDDISASGGYLKLLREFRDKQKDKIKPVLFKYKKLDNLKQLDLLWFLLQV